MLVLNIELGLIEVPDRFTPEEQARIEKIKREKEFTVNNVEYAGYCLRCSKKVQKHDVAYIENKSGNGHITVDTEHIHCQ